MSRETDIIQKIGKVSAIYNLYLNDELMETDLILIDGQTAPLMIDEYNINEDKELAKVFSNRKKTLTGYYREILRQKEELEQLIIRNLESWNFTRLNNIVKSLLITATYDFYNTDRERKIIFNETLEVAKFYLTDEEKNFVNKVLDKIVKDKEIVE
jgi:transcription termination factor NusB